MPGRKTREPWAFVMAHLHRAYSLHVSNTPTPVHEVDQRKVSFEFATVAVGRAVFLTF